MPPDPSGFELKARQLISEMEAKDRRREDTPLGQDDGDSERLRRNRLTWTEILDQPRAIEETLREEGAAVRAAAHAISRRPITRVYLVGCGDSLAAMLAMRGLLERLLGIPCEPMQALDYAYYYGSTDRDALVVALSSTGWTTRVAEALFRARAAGLRTIAISNSADAPIFSIGEIGLLVHATRLGWPTQSSTSAMALIARFGIELANEYGHAADEVARYELLLNRVPELVQEVIDRHRIAAAELAARELRTPLFLFSGGGPAYASATIGAAKIKECTNRHAVAIQIEEYHHYLSQMAGEPMFVVAPNGRSVRRSADAMHVGRANGGRLYGLVSKNTALRTESFDWSIGLPDIDELLTPLIYTVPLQVFAYQLGKLIAGASTE
jgi:glucosamine--fructose-6-phosphate aminotransferase (isomerizing)